MKSYGIKRYKALYPLSHHPQGLVISHRLMKAGTAESKFTNEDLKAKLQDFSYSGGNDHFREEEELLLPAFAKYALVDRPEIVENLLEDVRIRSMVRRVLEQLIISEPLMRELGALLESHIRKEERVIFPFIEQALPEEELLKLDSEFTELTPQ